MCLLALRSIGGMAFNTHSWNCIRYFPPIQMKIITLRSSLHLQAKCGFFPNAFAGWLLIVQLPAFFLCSESRYVYALWMCERFSLPNSMVRWHKQLKLFFVFVSVLKCSHCWYFYSYLVALNFLVYKNKRKKSKRNYRFHFSWYRFCIQTKIGFSQTKKNVYFAAINSGSQLSLYINLIQFIHTDDLSIEMLFWFFLPVRICFWCKQWHENYADWKCSLRKLRMNHRN